MSEETGQMSAAEAVLECFEIDDDTLRAFSTAEVAAGFLHTSKHVQKAEWRAPDQLDSHRAGSLKWFRLCACEFCEGRQADEV
jgi:hypothetical protein